jgi:hypothetical protein
VAFESAAKSIFAGGGFIDFSIRIAKVGFYVNIDFFALLR